MDSYRKQVMVGGDRVMLDIVDTAGQEDYAAVRDHYLRSADGYLCVFSLAEPESLQDIIDLKYDTIRAVFDGGWRVETPAKISDPPAAIKKRKGVDFNPPRGPPHANSHTIL